MDKKIIVKRIILIIIAVLLVLLVAHVIRNYIIINKVVSVQDKFLNSNNRSYEIELPAYLPYEKTCVGIYYREGKSRLEIKAFDAKGNEIPGFTVWYDEETKEAIHLGQSGKDASINDYGEGLTGFDMILTFTENDFFNKLRHAVFSIINYEEVNGEKCYKIKLLTTGVDNALYYRVSDGTMAKVYFPGETRNENGEVISTGSIIILKNFKTDSLTEEEMARPDLTGYNVTEHKMIPLDEYETYDEDE